MKHHFILLALLPPTLLVTDPAPAWAFYHPQIGNWLNRDPLGDAGVPSLLAQAPNKHSSADPLNAVAELNLYAFVRRNAVSLVDRDGRATYDFSKRNYPHLSGFAAGDVVILPDANGTISVTSGNQWPLDSSSPLGKVRCLLGKLGFAVPAPRNGVYLGRIPGNALGLTLMWPGPFWTKKASTFFEDADAHTLRATTSRGLVTRMWHELKGHNMDYQEDSTSFDRKYEDPVYAAWDRLYNMKIPPCACETQRGHWIMRTVLESFACQCGFER